MNKSLKISIVMIIVAVAIIAIGGIVIFSNHNETNKKDGNSNVYYTFIGTIDTNDETYKDRVIDTYSEYIELVDMYQVQSTLNEQDFDKYDYLAVIFGSDVCNYSVDKINNANINGDQVNISVEIKSDSSEYCMVEKKLYLIRFDKEKLPESVNTKIEYKNIECSNRDSNDPNVVYKPVIYLYPTVTTDVNVKLGKKENLLVTYPKYEDGWNVKATPNGNLTDKNGKNYYALYWEGIDYKIDITDEGFVVKGEDTIEFLEEKLKLLGLNERESNEFIMFWLPKLQINEYNYIRFASSEEINEMMPLEVTPQPDSVIRVLMVTKPLDKKIEVKEQKISTPKRDGFTVVEWGGTVKE